ncbi:Type II secretion system protein G precursor [compost metagenome]|uniref:type II secretion system protein n=1 Tax=Janthinobacterium lividum TaxID=29581 RepID=UPI000DFEB3A0|nr:type II secretion system protein [Janthinobacterium lividum]STR27625.1 PilD-dependent protein pddA [Janthinobacterium lividum]
MNKSLRSMKSGAQAGFTLIELIVVIVILGILAATAIPKFIDMSTEARVAKMQAAAGAVKAGAALYHAQYLVNGDSTKAVVMEGKTIKDAFGYPAASADGIQEAAGLSLDDYNVTFAGSVMTVAVDKATTRTSCSVVYTAPAAAGGAPGIVVNAKDENCG